ncbi:MAG: hypothetical protein FWG85_02485 [Bacteroidetes bacterium]|nr:hypothetical protein [Bacteroidota bacterium]
MGVVLIAITSCKDEDNLAPTPWVGGKFKLIKMRVVTTNSDIDSGWSKTETTDYSKDSIIYDFQFEENYNYVDTYWTPIWKLIVHNCIPTGLPNDIQESGEYFYQFRQPGYGYSVYVDRFSTKTIAESSPEMGYNLKISSNNDVMVYSVDCFASSYARTGVDIKRTTDTINIGTNGYGYNFRDEYGNSIKWTKIFVRTNI